MTCDEARYKLQALSDNELEEKDIPDAVSHLESCYRCRDEYVELLKLQRKLKGIAWPEPSPEWFEDMQKRIPRRITSIGGNLLFFGSYLLLLGYTVFSLIFQHGSPLPVRIGVGGLVAGLLVLLGITIGDRVRESRTDKYKGVMK